MEQELDAASQVMDESAVSLSLPPKEELQRERDSLKRQAQLCGVYVADCVSNNSMRLRINAVQPTVQQVAGHASNTMPMNDDDDVDGVPLPVAAPSQQQQQHSMYEEQEDIDGEDIDGVPLSLDLATHLVSSGSGGYNAFPLMSNNEYDDDDIDGVAMDDSAFAQVTTSASANQFIPVATIGSSIASTSNSNNHINNNSNKKKKEKAMASSAYSSDEDDTQNDAGPGRIDF
jgi:hypothetical protein